MAGRSAEACLSNSKDEKGLPVNIDAERYVLGAILMDDTFYIQASGVLEVNDFSLVKHRRIYKRMGEVHERGEHIDRVTIANELMKFNELESCDGLSYLVGLDDGMPMTPHIDSYIRLVKDASTLRSVIFASQHLINRAMMAEETPQEILAGARESFLTMGTDDDAAGPQTPEQIITSLPGGMTQFLSPPEKGLYTGFTKFDEKTCGLHKGEFTIIAARPSAGKSAFATNVAHHVAVNLKKTVMVFSLEMSKESLLRRMVCASARVDSQRVRLGYLNQDERHKLAVATQELAEARLFIDDSTAVSAAAMHSRVRRRMAIERVDLVIVDYLQLMSAGRTSGMKDMNREQEVSQISRGLKLLSNDVPVIGLSQLSRATETRKGGGNRPQLSDLRESGTLEQNADNVHFIFREEMYSRDREDLRGLAELIIAKQRAGPTGTVNLVFLHNLTKFVNRAEDADDFEPLLENTHGTL